MPRKRAGAPNIPTAAALKRQARSQEASAQQAYQIALQEELSKYPELMEMKMRDPEGFAQVIAPFTSPPVSTLIDPSSHIDTSPPSCSRSISSPTPSAARARSSSSRTASRRGARDASFSQPCPPSPVPFSSSLSVQSPSCVQPPSISSLSPACSRSSSCPAASCSSSVSLSYPLSQDSNLYPLPYSYTSLVPPSLSSYSSFPSSFSSRPSASSSSASSSSASSSSASSSSASSSSASSSTVVKREPITPPVRRRWEWALRDSYWLPFSEEDNKILDALEHRNSQQGVSLCFRAFLVHMHLKVIVDCHTRQQHRIRTTTTPLFVALPSTAREVDCVIKLAQSGFGLADAIEGAVACKADETAAISWLIARTEEADLSLQINRAMDQSRQHYEVESRTRLQGEALERAKCDVFTYAPFRQSVMLKEFPASLKELVTDNCRTALTNLLDLELKANSWYPSSKAYFGRLSAQLSLLQKTPAARDLSAFLTQANSKIQHALFSLPEVGGSVPELFREATGWVDDDEIGCIIVSNPKPKSIEESSRYSAYALLLLDQLVECKSIPEQTTEKLWTFSHESILFLSTLHLKFKLRVT